MARLSVRFMIYDPSRAQADIMSGTDCPLGVMRLQVLSAGGHLTGGL